MAQMGETQKSPMDTHNGGKQPPNVTAETPSPKIKTNFFFFFSSSERHFPRERVCLGRAYFFVPGLLEELKARPS